MASHSRRLVRAGARVARVVLGVALAVAVAQTASPGSSGEATLAIDVPAGSWKGVRLRNIPVNAILAASVATDGEIAVLLLDAAQYAAFPASPSPKTVFRGRTDDKLDFALRAPLRGDYYVIVDNRSGAEARTVQLVIRGEAAEAPPDAGLRTSPGT